MSVTTTSTSALPSWAYPAVPTSPTARSEPVTLSTASTADYKSTGTSPQNGHRSPTSLGSITSPTETLSHSPSYFRSNSAARQNAQSKSNELNAILEGGLPWNTAEEDTRLSSGALERIHPYQPQDPFSELKLQKPLANGQWSTVYTAACDASQRVPLAQQGLSEGTLLSNEKICALDQDHASARQGKNARELFAAKVGIGKSAGEVLRNESRILTFLMHRPHYKDFVVGFRGYDTQHKALVMEHIPLTLEHLVMELNAEQCSERRERIVKEFLPISRHLVAGLDFLHRENVIHGDIKPANILLRVRCVHPDRRVSHQGHPTSYYKTKGRERDSEDARSGEIFQLQPVYCDFSASRLNSPDSIPSDSAGTYDYMAPELFAISKPDSYPTFPSDVYALGVTLTYSVIGHSPYEVASNVFMRRAMAMRGSPLEFVAADTRSLSRMEEAGFQSWVEMAVKTRPQNRWTAVAWKRWIDDMFDGR